MRTPPIMRPYEPLLDRAVDISSKTRSGLYDCLYVALAEREGCELVTDDQKLIADVDRELEPDRDFAIASPLPAPETAAGKRAKCPSCGQIMIVPEPTRQAGEFGVMPSPPSPPPAGGHTARGIDPA